MGAMDHLGFSLEPCNTLSIPCKYFRQDLDRHIPAKLPVLRPINLSHAAAAQLDGNLVMPECYSDYRRVPLQIEVAYMLCGGAI